MGSEGIGVPLLIWRAIRVPPATICSTCLENGDGDEVYVKDALWCYLSAIKSELELGRLNLIGLQH